MKILTTIITVAIILGTITISVQADAAELFVPAAAAALVPTGHRAIDQLSSDDFVTSERSAGRSSTSDAKWHRQWAISLAPLFASQAVDAASSYGMQELNPLLASPDGSFGMKATTLKVGVIGVLTATEYFVMRKYPRSAKVFTLVNWTASGATSALAIHNYSLH